MQSFSDPSDGSEVVLSEKTTATPEPVRWGFRTFEGRLPIVMKHKMPNGEAATYSTPIFDKGGSGNPVLRLDFGYGRKTDEQIARLVVRAPELLAELENLVRQVRRYGPGVPVVLDISGAESLLNAMAG